MLNANTFDKTARPVLQAQLAAPAAHKGILISCFKQWCRSEYQYGVDDIRTRDLASLLVPCSTAYTPCKPVATRRGLPVLADFRGPLGRSVRFAWLDCDLDDGTPLVARTRCEFSKPAGNKRPVNR